MTKSIRKIFFSILALVVAINVAAIAGYSEEGRASWMGNRFQGQVTASGETFDMNEFTAAHPSLPFGKYAKVTSTRTNKSVIVRINDRSSSSNGRIIDLSKKAAEQIGIIEEGIGNVTVEVLESENNTFKNAANNGNSYQVQYGVFSNVDNAKSLQNELKGKQVDCTIQTTYEGSNNLFRVLSNEQFSNQEQAKCHMVLFNEGNGLVLPAKYEENNNIYGASLASQDSNLMGMTAAHATLPVGKKIEITSQANNKTVVVEIVKSINPSSVDYLEVSPDAAAEIELANNTVQYVNYQTVQFQTFNPQPTQQPKPTYTTSDTNKYQIQYGSFADFSNAQQLQLTLSKKNISAAIVEANGMHKVLSQEQYVGRNQAEYILSKNPEQYGLIVPAHNNTPKAVQAVNEQVSSNPSEYEYGLQFGAFGSQDNAQYLSNELSQKGIQTIIYQFPDDNKKLYRVLSSEPFMSKQSANDYLVTKGMTSSQATVLTFYKE